ncbi:uncharacterized protein LOC144768459 [Lissotriton helveticus]
MSCNWSGHSSHSRSASFLVPSTNVTLTELMENGFVADSSSYFISTPFHSPRVEGSGALKVRCSSHSSSLHVPTFNPSLMEMLENCFMADLSINSTSFHSFCAENGSALKIFAMAESTKLAADEMQKGLGTSDGLASICKTPVAPNAQLLDLSSLVSEHNSRFNNSIVDFFCDNKISTPCKCKEEKPLPVESQDSKSLETSEVMIDLSGLQKPTPLVWELSEINLPFDNTLSLDTSVEEWRSPSSMVAECASPISVEKSSLASAMSFNWTGTRPKKTTSLTFKSFAYDSQLKEQELGASLTSHSIKPFDFAIPSPDDRWFDKRQLVRSKIQKSFQM